MRTMCALAVSILCVGALTGAAYYAQAAAGEDTTTQAAPAVQMMLRTEVGRALNLGPVMAAAERAGLQAVQADSRQIVLQFAGRSNNYAYVRSSGEIIIASAKELYYLEDMDQLHSDLELIYSFIADVTSGLTRGTKGATLYYNCTYYLADPSIYKRVVFPPGEYKGELHVPNCEVYQARVKGFPLGDANGTVRLRGTSVYGTGMRGLRASSDVTADLVYGSHPVLLDTHGRFRREDTGPVIVVEAVTSSTSDSLYYTGGAIKNVIVSQVRSLSGGLPAAQGAPGLPLAPAAQPGPFKVPEPTRAELQTTVGTRIRLWSPTGGTLGGLAERANCKVPSVTEDEVVIHFASGSGNYASVRANGEISIASAKGMTSLADVSALHKDLAAVYSFVKEINPDLGDDTGSDCLYHKCKYSLSPDVHYQRLVLPPGRYDLELLVPDGEIREARVLILPAPGQDGVVICAGEELYRGSTGPTREGIVECNVTEKLTPGSHPFAYHKRFSRASVSVAVEILTAAATEPLAFTGEGAERVIRPEVTTIETPAAGDEAPS